MYLSNFSLYIRVYGLTQGCKNEYWQTPEIVMKIQYKHYATSEISINLIKNTRLSFIFNQY